MEKSKWIIGILLILCGILGYLLFFKSNPQHDENQEAILVMKQKNNAIRDSLSLILSQLSRQDSLYQVQKDSLTNRLEIIESISNGLNNKMSGITKRIDQNIGTSWDELTQRQKDSIVSSAFKTNR